MVADRVAVIGAGGHIGLPLSVVLAEAGFDVYGIDRSPELNRRLNSGEIPYVEHGAAPLMAAALERGNLRFTADDRSLATAEVIVVVIGTPVDDNLNPRIDPLIDLFQRHASVMPRGQLIVLRSTVSPDTTGLLRSVLEDATGWLEGEDFYLVFAPERVLQTRAVEEIQTLPQMVGSFSDAGFAQAERFFSRFVHSRCIPMSPIEAELGKLITNMARYVSFALANEFYMICDSYGANAHKVINSANEDYPRLSLPRPGPNVGGPCLYKDGYYLIERLQFPEIIANSFKINESVPRYLLEKVRARTSLKRVGILGLAFKADCDDTRNSLSFKLIKQIRGMHAQPVAVDPYVPEFSDPSRLTGVDALFLMTPHREFGELEKYLSIIDNPDCLVVDMWNFWPEAAGLSHDGIYRAGDILNKLDGQVSNSEGVL